MSTRNGYEHGIFNWVDLFTPDLEDSKGFYGELFGWKAVDQQTDNGAAYTMFLQGEHRIAGMGKLNEAMQQRGVPSHWHSYVNVTNLAETLQKVTPAGGQILMPAMDVMDAGSMAVISDSNGAALSLWQANKHIGAELVNEPVALAWNELATRDVEKSSKFYEQVMGWTYNDMEMPNPYRVIQVGEIMNGGIIKMDEHWPEGIPSHWSVYFAVNDCDATVQKVTELGGTILVPPMDIPPGRFSVVADRHNANFYVMKLNQTE